MVRAYTLTKAYTMAIERELGHLATPQPPHQLLRILDGTLDGLLRQLDELVRDDAISTADSAPK